ncbi:HU family DNA-binding protein [Halopseudomonas yangmingensis]|uniref:DNA-binding protein n=1 Tax=Halopseudomonas yangmingensis TaxID=1720063 RepID=A0A1I4ND37_9GAMM|nr:DNA-binding protein [Halopseudomonas yangmingensis]
MKTSDKFIQIGRSAVAFGTQQGALNYRPPRQGRNPKTGQKVEIPAKHVPHFKAGKELRDRVDATVAPDTKQQRKYTLDKLLAQCKSDAPSPRISGWDDMAPLGKELL